MNYSGDILNRLLSMGPSICAIKGREGHGAESARVYFNDGTAVYIRKVTKAHIPKRAKPKEESEDDD